MDFLVSPPEVNSARMHAGAGSDPTWGAVAGWDRLAAELHSAAASFGSVTSGLSGGPWQGPSSAAMGDAAAAYVAWLGTVAAQAEQAAAQARVTAVAFEAALAQTVHPTAVAANRARLVSLVGSNLFGRNAAAIAAIEAEYEQMWAQDVAAMVGYHASASLAAGQLMPWQRPPQSLAAEASVSSSEIRIIVPGAAPGLLTGRETLLQYAAINLAIGENWLTGTTPTVVNYPATAGVLSGRSAPTADNAFAIGQHALNAEILSAVATGQPVVVTGLSEGTIVIDHEEAYLAGNPNAPSPSQLTFVEFANPERGLADTYLPSGDAVRGVGYTVAEALELHTSTELVFPSQGVEVSSVTNSLGGTTTTYMIPTTTLPMLMPLQHIGVPSPIVNTLNGMLTPVVNEGYSQYDPNAGPYFSQGHLVW